MLWLCENIDEAFDISGSARFCPGCGKILPRPAQDDAVKVTTKSLRVKLTWFKKTGKFYTNEVIDLSEKFGPGSNTYEIYSYIEEKYMKGMGNFSHPYCLVELLDEYPEGPYDVPKLLLKHKES